MSKNDIEDFKKNSQEVTFLTEDGQTVSVPKNRVDPRVLEENSQASPDYMNIQEVETDEQGRALIDRKTGQVKYKSKYDGMFGLEKVGKSIDLGALLDAQYVTQTVGGGVGSVGGFMIGGGGVAKAMESVSAFSKSSRALNALKTTYGAEAVEAAGLYGKAAAKLTRGAKAEEISGPEYATSVGLLMKGLEELAANYQHEIYEKPVINNLNNQEELEIGIQPTQHKKTAKAEVIVEEESVIQKPKREEIVDEFLDQEIGEKKEAKSKPEKKNFFSKWTDKFIQMINETE